MKRRGAARRPRGNAEARPDAKAGIRATSRVTPTTAHHGRPRTSPSLSISAEEARLVAEVSSWLSDLRDWFDEQLAQAALGNVPLRRSDVERIRIGLTNSAGNLDGITLAPAALTASSEPASDMDRPLISRSLH